MPSVAGFDDINVPLVDQVAYTPQKLRVVTIGAGYSGLIFAHQLQHEQPDLQEFIDHTIYELESGMSVAMLIYQLLVSKH